MAMQEQMLNLHGRMHGGALYSLIDTALGQASHSLFGGEAGSMTLECKVNYIRGVEAGEVVCHARVLNAGRKVHVLEARVEQGDKLIATAQATFICK
jgi:acyl-CoA thioesterase